MHELGIARSILDLVEQHAPAGQAGRVRAVRVRVGALAGVVPESLAFCFEALVASTPLAEARLEVERVAARARCRGCGRESEVAIPFFRCAGCGSPHTELVEGRELEVVSLELADAGSEVP